MAIEDQQAITTHSSGPSMLLKMPNPINAFLICCPTVIGNSDHPVSWESAVLVPRSEVVFPCNNDKRRHRPALELTPWITVTHSRLPGCIFFAFARPSELVTTVAV